MKLKSLLLILIVIWIRPTLAQDLKGKVFANNSEDGGAIRLKYLPEHLVHQEGFVIYRKSEGSDWEKINEVPLRPDPDFPLGKMPQAEQDVFRTLAKVNGQELVGLEKLSILSQICTYDDYAFMLGLRYNDLQVQRGKKYKYRVAAIIKNGEDDLGESEWVLAGEFIPIAPPDSIRMIYVNEDEIAFRWKPEINRYFGINAYKTDLGSGERKRVNDDPIVIGRSYNELGILSWPDYFFVDSAILKQENYRYEFSAVDVFGEEGPTSHPIDVFVPDTKAPKKVTNGSAKGQADGKTILLTWDPSKSKDVAGYQIYRSKNSKGGFEKINDQRVTGSTYMDKLDRPGDYFYHIYAEDASGNRSESSLILGELLDIIPPDGPRGVRALIYRDHVTIKWEPVDIWDLYGYRILRAVGEHPADQDFTPVEESYLTETSFVDDITLGTEVVYTYGVIVVDSFNLQSPIIRSNPVIVEDITPPKSATITMVRQVAGTMQIEWLPSPNADVVGYQLLRSASADTTEWEILHRDLLPSNTRSFVDKNAAAGDYYYRVVAVDDAGLQSAPSNYFHFVWIPDQEVERDVIKINADFKKTDQLVQIRWKLDEPASVRGVVLFRQEEGEEWLPISSLSKEERFADEDIENGKTYNYQLRRYGLQGQMRKSNIRTVVVDI